jgi:hypothetical protein
MVGCVAVCRKKEKFGEADCRFLKMVFSATILGALALLGVPTLAQEDSYPVTYRKNQPIDSPRARYTGFKPYSYLLKAGTVRRLGAKPLPCDIIFERDVAVKLRDGITIYTDVFRPAGNVTAPGIIAWGPYGKQIGGQHLDGMSFRSIELAELIRCAGTSWSAFWLGL